MVIGGQARLIKNGDRWEHNQTFLHKPNYNSSQYDIFTFWLQLIRSDFTRHFNHPFRLLSSPQFF